MRGIDTPDNRMTELGDYIARHGFYTKPGVVTKIEPDGRLQVDTDPEKIKRFHEFAITNGLSLEEKEEFNGIMREVSAIKDDGTRIFELQKIIDKLKTIPKEKRVADFLTNQQGNLIRKSKVLPKIYNINMSPGMATTGKAESLPD